MESLTGKWKPCKTLSYSIEKGGYRLKVEITTTQILPVKINLTRNREARQSWKNIEALVFYIHIVACKSLEEADCFDRECPASGPLT